MPFPRRWGCPHDQGRHPGIATTTRIFYRKRMFPWRRVGTINDWFTLENTYKHTDYDFGISCA